MATTTFTQLVASPTRLITPKEQPSPNHTPNNISLIHDEPFPIAHLPYELRQLIYIHYFTSLPTQDITCSNTRLPHHAQTPLAFSSPFLAFDPSPNLFYRYTTFNFSCPEALKTFSKMLSSDPAQRSNPEEISGKVEKRRDIHKVKILYGRYDQPTRDWVYLLTSNFPQLEEVTFSVDREKGRLGVGNLCFGNWWGCVRDTVREGLAGSSARSQMVLKAEDGEWGVVEVVRV